jgi:hypothetical protein
MKQFVAAPCFILAGSTTVLPLMILFFLTGIAAGIYFRDDRNED